MTAESTPLTWTEVVAVHRSQSGISTHNGTVRSLLCNQSKEGPYADEVREHQIFYRVTTSTNKTSVSALRNMKNSGLTFRVFEKLAKNCWRDHGHWRVSDVAEEPEGTLFLLTRLQDSPLGIGEPPQE
jgi:hypothetical protein